MRRLENKRILITGAASGIGRAIAKRAVEEGAEVGLLDINEPALKTLIDELKPSQSKVAYAVADVADFDQMAKSIDVLAKELGGLQGVSHNAGILRCYHTHKMTLSQWQELIDVNLTGTFNVNRHVLSYLLDNDKSYLVNMSSIAADYRHPWMAAYSATKGAIKSFTRSLFVEYCLQGLHANCVMPGSIESDLGSSFSIPDGASPDLIKTLVPLGESKMVSADNVAGVVALLLSAEADHINGTEITVDGGKIF